MTALAAVRRDEAGREALRLELERMRPATATRAEHARILEAVVAADPELARTVAAAHVANSEHWLRTDLQRAAAAPEAAG